MPCFQGEAKYSTASRRSAKPAPSKECEWWSGEDPSPAIKRLRTLRCRAQECLDAVETPQDLVHYLAEWPALLGIEPSDRPLLESHLALTHFLSDFGITPSLARRLDGSGQTGYEFLRPRPGDEPLSWKDIGTLAWPMAGLKDLPSPPASPGKDAASLLASTGLSDVRWPWTTSLGAQDLLRIATLLAHANEDLAKETGLTRGVLGLKGRLLLDLGASGATMHRSNALFAGSADPLRPNERHGALLNMPFSSMGAPEKLLLHLIDCVPPGRSNLPSRARPSPVLCWRPPASVGPSRHSIVARFLRTRGARPIELPNRSVAGQPGCRLVPGRARQGHGQKARCPLLPEWEPIFAALRKEEISALTAKGQTASRLRM